MSPSDFQFIYMHSCFPILLSGLESVIFIINFDLQIVLSCPRVPFIL